MGKVDLKELGVESHPEVENWETETVPFFRREFDVDIIGEFEDLKAIAALSSEALRDRSMLAMALNDAARNSWRANRIYLKAKRERELFRIEQQKAMRELRRRATARLRLWLEASGNTKKQITEAMILEEIAVDPADGKLYEALRVREEDLCEIRDNLKSLSESWSNRIDTLRSQASLLKEQRELVLNTNRKEN